MICLLGIIFFLLQWENPIGVLKFVMRHMKHQRVDTTTCHEINNTTYYTIQQLVFFCHKTSDASTLQEKMEIKILTPAKMVIKIDREGVIEICGGRDKK